MSPTMGRGDPRYLVVGHINKPHGMKGELFVWPLTDHPEGVYAPGVVLRSGDGQSEAPAADGPPLRVLRARPFRRGLIVSFVGVENRDAAELLRDLYLFQDIESLEPLQEGEVFYHQLLGMEVRTSGGTRVGVVEEVYELRPADLLQVRTDAGEVMIPFVDEFVVDVDSDGRVLTVNPPEGLLDL